MREKPRTLEHFPWHIWEPHQGNQRFRSAAGRAGRIICGRLLPGSDLLNGIIEMAKAHQVGAAWVNAFGSLAKAAFSPGIQIVRSNPDRVERMSNVTLPGPIEMWSGMGRVGIPPKGEPIIHFHGLLVDQTGRLVGGHFFPGNNIVYATFEVHLQEILDVTFNLKRDPEVELPLIEPIQST